MRKEYDFTKARRNPCAARLKAQVTIRMDKPTIAYFKTLSNRDWPTLSNADQSLPS